MNGETRDPKKPVKEAKPADKIAALASELSESIRQVTDQASAMMLRGQYEEALEMLESLESGLQNHPEVLRKIREIQAQVRRDADFTGMDNPTLVQDPGGGLIRESEERGPDDPTLVRDGLPPGIGMPKDLDQDPDQENEFDGPTAVQDPAGKTGAKDDSSSAIASGSPLADRLRALKARHGQKLSAATPALKPAPIVPAAKPATPPAAKPPVKTPEPVRPAAVGVNTEPVEPIAFDATDEPAEPVETVDPVAAGDSVEVLDEHRQRNWIMIGSAAGLALVVLLLVLLGAFSKRRATRETKPAGKSATDRAATGKTVASASAPAVPDAAVAIVAEPAQPRTPPQPDAAVAKETKPVKQVRVRLTVEPAAAPVVVTFRGKTYKGANFESPQAAPADAAEVLVVSARGYEKKELKLTIDRDITRTVVLKPLDPPRKTVAAVRPRPRPRPRWVAKRRKTFRKTARRTRPGRARGRKPARKKSKLFTLD